MTGEISLWKIFDILHKGALRKVTIMWAEMLALYGFPPFQLLFLRLPNEMRFPFFPSRAYTFKITGKICLLSLLGFPYLSKGCIIRCRHTDASAY